MTKQGKHRGSIDAWLWTPSARVTDARERRICKLLAQMQLAVVVVGLAAICTPPRDFARGYCYDAPTLTALGIVLFLAVLYAFTRMGYYKAPMALFIITICGAPLYFSAVYETDFAVWTLFYLAVPLLVASIFLSHALLFVLYLALVAGQMAIAFASPHMDIHSLPVFFLTMVFVLILVASRHQGKLEEIRQRELEESRERYRNLLRTMFEGIAILDRGVVVEANEGFAGIFGAAVKEVLGKPVSVFLPEWDEEAGQQANRTWRQRLNKSNGDPVWVEFAVSRAGDAQRDAHVIAIRDITAQHVADEKRKALEGQIQHMQRIESIGVLAGGVAHDFNNLLVAILGQADALLAESEPGSRVHRAAGIIDQAGQHAADLTRKLLGFARRGKHQNVAIAMHGLLADTKALLDRTLEKNVRIEVDFQARRDVVMGDPHQLEQVFMNLCINARDAMPGGGRIVLRTQEVELREDFCAHHPGAAPGRYVLCTVEDEGPGIAPEDQGKVFEPFYTTKERGKGTGLGLAMVYGIVKAHQGYIEINSQVGRGARMHVYLPLEQKAEPRAAEPASAAPKKGKGTIAVVDDEEIVRTMIGEMLGRLGYDARLFDGGPSAIEHYRQNPGDIGLFVIDLQMPGMGARECFRELKAINPAVRALLSTGYGLNEEAQDALEEGMAGFVQKPYRLSVLAEAVSQALPEHPHPGE